MFLVKAVSLLLLINGSGSVTLASFFICHSPLYAYWWTKAKIKNLKLILYYKSCFYRVSQRMIWQHALTVRSRLLICCIKSKRFKESIASQLTRFLRIGLRLSSSRVALCQSFLVCFLFCCPQCCKMYWCAALWVSFIVVIPCNLES